MDPAGHGVRHRRHRRLGQRRSQRDDDCCGSQVAGRGRDGEPVAASRYPGNRGVVMELDDSEECQVIVRALIDLAHNLSLNVCAEGVETEEQLKLLQMEQCNQYQGYLFSKPLPESELSGLLKK